MSILFAVVQVTFVLPNRVPSVVDHEFHLPRRPGPRPQLLPPEAPRIQVSPDRRAERRQKTKLRLAQETKGLLGSGDLRTYAVLGSSYFWTCRKGRNLAQPTRAKPVHALFVFLDLLESDTKLFSERVPR